MCDGHLCAVCVDVQNVCAMGWMLFVEIVQLCADGRPARLCSGVLSGALEHVKRSVCENVLCVQRRALLGGDGGVEEREEVDIRRSPPVREFGFRSLNC